MKEMNKKKSLPIAFSYNISFFIHKVLVDKNELQTLECVAETNTKEKSKLGKEGQAFEAEEKKKVNGSKRLEQEMHEKCLRN